MNHILRTHQTKSLGTLVLRWTQNFSTVIRKCVGCLQCVKNIRYLYSMHRKHLHKPQWIRLIIFITSNTNVHKKFWTHIRQLWRVVYLKITLSLISRWQSVWLPFYWPLYDRMDRLEFMLASIIMIGIYISFTRSWASLKYIRNRMAKFIWDATSSRKWNPFKTLL